MKYILHVEDEAIKARAVRRLVRTAAPGLEVRVVGSLDAFFAAIVNEDPPVAVITDWCFPEHDGGGELEENGRAVVYACRHMELPCLVVSGSSEPDEDMHGATWAYEWPSDVRSWLGTIEIEESR